MPIIICPKCGKIIALHVTRDTTINCPKCNKAISIHFKADGQPFKIVQCPRCRNHQVVKARKTFKCRYCGYSTEMHKLRILGSAEKSREATEKILKMKKA